MNYNKNIHFELENQEEMLRGKKTLTKFQEHKALINSKSKRRRNLVKKSIELSELCDVDVFLMIRDRKYQRVTTFESGGTDDGKDRFDIDMALQLLQELKDQVSATQYDPDHIWEHI